jgi:hypothetical protein
LKYLLDADKMLEEVGIKLESKQRDPLAVFVLLETLRAAGIAVQDFILV